MRVVNQVYLQVFSSKSNMSARRQCGQPLVVFKQSFPDRTSEFGSHCAELPQQLWWGWNLCYPLPSRPWDPGAAARPPLLGRAHLLDRFMGTWGRRATVTSTSVCVTECDEERNTASDDNKARESGSQVTRCQQMQVKGVFHQMLAFEWGCLHLGYLILVLETSMRS